MNTAEDLLNQALALEEEQRATLALRLMESLGPPEPRDEGAWIAEIERRAQRALSGQSSGAPLEEALDRIERKLGL